MKHINLSLKGGTQSWTVLVLKFKVNVVQHT